MIRIIVTISVTLLFLTLIFGLIIPLKQIFADTVIMKAKLMCLNSSTGKYKISITLVGYYPPGENFTPIKHGDKQTKTLDLGKIVKKSGSTEYTASFKFKHVNIGYFYQAESISAKNKFRFSETIGFLEHGQDVLFPLDTHTCRTG